MCPLLADQSIRYPAGIAEDILVKIWNFLIPVDFMVLDMEINSKTPLILGRPFLSTTEANIDVGAGQAISTSMAEGKCLTSDRKWNNADSEVIQEPRTWGHIKGKS